MSKKPDFNLDLTSNDAVEAFDKGFKYCAADCADRPDLIADMDSRTYLRDRGRALGLDNMQPQDAPTTTARSAVMALYSNSIHSHCWHGTGTALLSDPPQYTQVCCFCGEKRTLTLFTESYRSGHGEFHPDNYREK